MVDYCYHCYSSRVVDGLLLLLPPPPPLLLLLLLLLCGLHLADRRLLRLQPRRSPSRRESAGASG